MNAAFPFEPRNLIPRFMPNRKSVILLEPEANKIQKYKTIQNTVNATKTPETPTRICRIEKSRQR